MSSNAAGCGSGTANQQSLAIADLTSATLTTGSLLAPLGSITSLTAATVTADKHFIKSNAAGYGMAT